MSLYPLMIGLLYMYFSPVFLYIIITITIFYFFDWRHWMQMIWPKKNSKLEKEKNRLKWKRINKENEKCKQTKFPRKFYTFPISQLTLISSW